MIEWLVRAALHYATTLPWWVVVVLVLASAALIASFVRIGLSGLRFLSLCAFGLVVGWAVAQVLPWSDYVSPDRLDPLRWFGW